MKMKKVFINCQHIDCDWLIELGNGRFKCCDCRSPLYKKAEIKWDETKQTACEFMHFKPEKRKLELQFINS